EFTITNTGSGTLSGSITTPSGYSVALHSAKNTSVLKAINDSQATRDVLPYSLGAGLSATYDVTFTPIAAVAYNDDITISHDAGGADKTISLTGAGISPQTVPFAEGFEDGIGNWNLVNGSQTNTWARGTATKHTGAYSLYISNNSGTSNAYDIASTSIAHVYRNISFPAGSESYKLRFAWKGQGEGASTYYDYLRVYLVDSTTTPVAGTALVSGQLGATYNLTADWQEVTLDIPAGVNGTNRRLVFTWRNDSSDGTQPPAAIDNIRIVAGEQSDAAVIIGDEVVITPPPAYDPVANPIAPVISITGLTGASGYITVTTGYASVGAPYETSGLDFIFAGANFAGATLNITHNLGYTPSQLAYKIGDGANWTVISNPGGWTDTAASFTVPSGGKGENDVFIVFNNSEEGTLPITLSSFTANLTGVCNVSLNWVTATETGVLGYYIYRALSDDLASAQKVSPLVQATNSSTEQSYTFTDEETEANLQYYYWLEGLDLDGGNGYYGPIGISTADDPDNPNPPAIPLLTELMGNYPNPFNPNTNLRYSLKEPAIVNFQIWNSRGQIVARFTQEHNTPGYYNLPFNGKDQSGRDLATGVYFCRMTVGNKVFNRKMLLMK
ncbi:MAG: T9SS type A sorting domain-containing protein, partial [Candidatus Cloacimonetes bacterium]|nr:T9SS type A sorting domain-containing protein [Candidatus Cloacimonadota bacterium]